MLRLSSKDLRTLANQREAIHRGHKSSRPLSPHYEYVGLKGEQAVAEYLGLEIDTTLRPRGDNGRDMVFRGVTIDAKTFRRPYCLLVEKGHVHEGNVYVLVGYRESDDTTELLGWEWGSAVASAPVKDFKRGVDNHYIPAAQLRQMSTIWTEL